MLTCIYHPLDDMRVVEQHEAEQLIKTGVWFDSPALAKECRAKADKDVKDKKAKSEKKKPAKPQNKTEEKTS